MWLWDGRHAPLVRRFQVRGGRPARVSRREEKVPAEGRGGVKEWPADAAREPHVAEACGYHGASSWGCPRPTAHVVGRHR